MSLILTNSQLAELAAGFGQLDGIRLSVDSFKPFKFDDDTVWKIASNHSLIVHALGAFDRAKKMLATRHEIIEGMRVTPENAAQVQEFMIALSVLQEKQVEVSGMSKISRSELKVGQNQIPPSTLTRLMPILTEGL